MTLPLLVSVPHAGVRVPDGFRELCLLTEAEIVADGDEGSREIYALRDDVAQFVTTDVARAVVDMNRAADDIRKDGVVKTHTCWDVPVWRRPLTEDEIGHLLDTYHRPYHDALGDVSSGVLAGLDCHTMASHGPPVGPDPGAERPAICLGTADGTCPADWLDALADCLAAAFGFQPSHNVPFAGGHVIRSHAGALPWIQVEFSRAPLLSLDAKRQQFLEAIEAWCRRIV